MVCISNALMVGGGIAGLSAAIALSRAGVQCDVVELFDSPLGASLALSGRAAEALDELGVYEACCATGRPFGSGDTKAMYQWDVAGNLLSRGPQRPTWPGAKDAVAVYRPAFIQVLSEEARRLGVTIRTGITTERIDDYGDACAVTFTDGSTGRYDLVVGADGIGSRTRSTLFPEDPGPTYAGQISIRWMVPGPAVEGEGWYLGPVGRFGFYYLPHQNQIYVPAVISEPIWERKSKKQVLALFTRLLDSYTAPAVVALRDRLTPDADLICRPFDWILVPGPWHRGRTLLIGDAAHATTAHMGMGGGMALEDSVVLGQCIAAAITLDDALTAFMARRFERVRSVVETSVGLSRLEQANAPMSENIALLTKAFQSLAQPY